MNPKDRRTMTGPTHNHKGQTAADVRAERIADALQLAEGMVCAIRMEAAEPAPSDGWHWGHAGDWGHILELVQDAAGAISIRQ